MPIVAAEREVDDAQGSVAFFIHENKDRCGNTSAKIFGVGSCHVFRERTTVDYECKGSGAVRQPVRVAGLRRFQRGFDEVRACIGGYGSDAEPLARDIVELEAKPESEDPDEAAGDKASVVTACILL